MIHEDTNGVPFNTSGKAYQVSRYIRVRHEGGRYVEVSGEAGAYDVEEAYDSRRTYQRYSYARRYAEALSLKYPNSVTVELYEVNEDTLRLYGAYGREVYAKGAYDPYL